MATPKFEPETYGGTNNLQKRDANEFFEKLQARFGKRRFETVLDIGSGCGDITQTISGYIECTNIVGADISSEMVEYANKTYGNEKIRFAQANITEEEQFKKLSLSSPVDLIVSIHCLHWVKEKYPEAIQNIYALLKPGAEAHLLVFSASDLGAVCTEVFTAPRWKNYYPEISTASKEVAQARLFPFPNVENWKSTAKSVGFHDITVKVEKAYTQYENVDSAMAALKGMQGYLISRVPENERGDFLVDMRTAFHEYNLGQECYPKLQHNYEYFVMELKKPE